MDRVWDARWAVRLACFGLFLDIAMIHRFEHGLWQWSASYRVLLDNMGWFIGLIVIFSFAVSIVMPVLVFVLRPLIGWLLMHMLPQRSSERYQRRLGEVPADVFHDFALSEKSDFLLRIHEKHEQEKKAISDSREQVGRLTATVLLGLALDWWFSRSAAGGLIGSGIELLGQGAYFVMLVAVLCAILILNDVWFYPHEPDVIHYPPLDREIREREQRDKGFIP